jgi:hypothetical protein
MLSDAISATRLRKIGEGIWTINGDPISFLTFPYTLRGTVVDLGDGSLFVYSPVQLSVAREAVNSLGSVAHIVSPNKLHHLFLGEWQAAFPGSRLYAPPGLRAKRPDLQFEAELGDQANSTWSHVIEQRVVRGSFFMAEVVFFHRPSGTLLVGDLIENHDARGFDRWHRAVARANGMLAPSGTTPRNYRFTFWRRSQARRTVREVLSWNPKRVVLVHSPDIVEDAQPFLRHAFAWLLKT